MGLKIKLSVLSIVFFLVSILTLSLVYAYPKTETTLSGTLNYIVPSNIFIKSNNETLGDV